MYHFFCQVPCIVLAGSSHVREQILPLPIITESLTPLLGTFCRLDFIPIYLDALPVGFIFLVSHLAALPKKLGTANLHLTRMLT